MLLLLFAQSTATDTTWAKGGNSSQWNASATQFPGWSNDSANSPAWQPDTAQPPAFEPSTDSPSTWL